MNPHPSLACSRRHFLRRSASLVVGAPFAWDSAARLLAATPPSISASVHSSAKVAIVASKTYGPEVASALRKSFDLLGGIGSLVKDKTVTVKLNLTGTNFTSFLGRPVGETFMTHPATVMALVTTLAEAGARRIRLVESTNSKSSLESTLSLADWDVNALSAAGKVEYENTRNRGLGKGYSQLKVPGGGYMFSSFDFNHSYADTDVLISLAKLKNHITAGVTCAMKNMFGATPNSLYGDQAGTEDATGGRMPLHYPTGFEKVRLPGLKADAPFKDPFSRIPHIVADIAAARPIHLSIIDGITSMSGGEGPWCTEAGPIKFVSPGILIAGLNPVSTDAVCTALMGYDNPRASRGTRPFKECDNHILLAEQAGVGVADLARIDVRGLTISQARHPYAFQ